MLESPQANRSYERVRALIALRARYSAHFKPKGNVVDDIAPGEQIQVLPHHDRVSAQRAGTIRMLRVLHANVTGSRRFEPANDLDERALAATTRSEQARETPGTKMMREAVKCFNLGNPLPPDLRHLLDHNIHAKRSYARLYLRTGTKRPQRAPSITITAMTRGGLPAAGLVAEEIHTLGRIIRQLNASGITVVLVEHHMELVISISDRVTVLDYGVVIADGPPAAIQRDERVIAAYLGTPHAAA